LPCPFCGNTPSLKEDEGYEHTYYIHCLSTKCVVHATTGFGRKEDVVKIWNTRPAASTDRLREAYEKAETVVFKYAPEVDITVYPKTGKTILHYRERLGDWLNDRTTDTDFTGGRKWKEFTSPEEAFEFLAGLHPTAMSALEETNE
jgi:hypothetical protein